MARHHTYQRIRIDGFAEGPVPQETYAEVVGPAGDAFRRAAAFENRVMVLIDQIDTRQTGRLVLRHLQRVGGGNEISIQPASLFQRGGDAATIDLTAFAASTEETRGRLLADSYARGARIPGPYPPGTGRGVPVILRLQSDSRAACQFEGSPDVVLLHELVHAIRKITGTQQHITMRTYDEFEEFVAVTLTDVYLSEVHQPLRSGHGCEPMNQDLATFRVVYRRFLNRIEQEPIHAPLINQIRALPGSVARWNPFVPLHHIDLVDGDPDPVDPFVRGFLAALPEAIRATTSLSDGINAILHRLGPNGRIGRLRIIGHGDTGLQAVVHSHRPWVRGVIIEIAPNGQLRGQSTLGQLTGRFWAGGWVELHGCNVAADGGALIRALCQLWNVPVKAAFGRQDPGGGLDGPVSVAWPDGRLEQRSSDRAR